MSLFYSGHFLVGKSTGRGLTQQHHFGIMLQRRHGPPCHGLTIGYRRPVFNCPAGDSR